MILTFEQMKEVQRITVEVWKYLADHPDIMYKSNLPTKLYEKIKNCVASCPLCDLFYRYNEQHDCPGCPLDTAGYNCNYFGSPFSKWRDSQYHDDETRREQAIVIYTVVKNWKLEKEDTDVLS